jgi:mono/diheme cytochrome c family protein
MKVFFNKKILLVSVLLLSAAAIFIFSTSSPKIDFNTQVKPIFNKKCIACHGGVKPGAGVAPAAVGRPGQGHQSAHQMQAMQARDQIEKAVGRIGGQETAGREIQRNDPG